VEKTTDVAEPGAAVASETPAPVSGVLPSVDTSLESQPRITGLAEVDTPELGLEDVFIGSTETALASKLGFETKKSDPLISKEDIARFAIAQQVANPRFAQSLSTLSSFAKGVVDIVDLAADVGEFALETGTPTGAAQYFAKRKAAQIMGLSEEEYDKQDPANLVDLSPLSDLFDAAIIKYYDEEGKRADFMTLASEGKYDDAIGSFVDEAAGALPSLLTAMLPGGYALLGGGSFVQTLNKDLIERKDQTEEKIFANSLIYGAADAVGEFFGGRYFKGLLKPLRDKKATEIPDDVKDAMVGGFGSFIKKTFKGGSIESMQEALTSIIQNASNDILYGDDVTLKRYATQALHSGLLGFALGGGMGGGITLKNRNEKAKFYEYIAPSSYKKQQHDFALKQEEAESDLENATENKKEYFQKRVDKIKQKRQDLKDKLFATYENASNEQIQYDLEKLQEQFDNVDIITGGDKYSRAAKNDAEKALKKAARDRESLFAATGLKIKGVDALKYKVTDAVAQQIKKRRDNLWFKAKDLKYEFVDTAEQYEKAIEKYGVDGASADGFFETTVDGKKKIFVNTNIASQTRAANVIGHELLHYAMSNRFAEDPEGMRESVIAFKDYVANIKGGDYILKSLEKRFIDGKYAKDGKISYDDDGLVIMNRPSDIEEYFNAFSDLIDGELIEAVEERSDGIKNKFRTMARGLGIGAKEVDFKNGQEIFDLLIDYNKNINAEGLLAARRQRKAVEAVAGKEIKPVGKTFRKKSMTAAEKANAEAQVRKLGAEGLLGESFVEQAKEFGEGIGKQMFDAEFKDIYKKIQNEGYLDNLIAAKYKGETVPIDFVKKVYSELTPHAKRFNPENKSADLFIWLNSQIGNKATQLYNREYKVDKTTAGRAKDIGERTEEGEVKVQVAAETDAALQRLEEEDVSITAQIKAKKAEADPEAAEKQSEFRRALGFETKGKIYNKVLESTKKTIRSAYRKTENISNPVERANAIREIIRKEYFSDRSSKGTGITNDLFKLVKDFLGTKAYIKNLKEHREAIVNAISTADFVQIERKIPENERIFTVYKRTLTSKKDVVDAINKGLLPLEAKNKIDKGQAVREYRKRMPSPEELVSYADQPAINPETGARSGKKGTRKDGLAKAMVTALVFDATMEVRQSEDVVDALDNDVSDLMELSAAIGREVDVKFSKSTAVVDINNAIDGNTSVAVYSQIRFSKSHREAYEARLAKRRNDLDEDQIKKAVNSIFKFVDGENIPNNKKSKYEKLAMHYMANGFLILPEDGYKVIEADRIATIKKIDPFSYKNPNELIERFVGEVKGARTNPDTVKEFTNKKTLSNGVTVYDVADSKEGQIAVRKVIDTHFGKKANPWCLAARGGEYLYTEEAFNEAEKDSIVKAEEAKGHIVSVHEFSDEGVDGYEIIVKAKPEAINELEDSFTHWQNYNKEGNGFKIAFKNGKLLCFRDGNRKQWWDRNDRASDKIHFIVKEKKGDVESTFSVVPEEGTKTLTRRIKGKMPNAEVFYVDDSVYYNIKSNTTYVDGLITKQRVETTYKDSKSSTGVYVSAISLQKGQLYAKDEIGVPDIQVNKITKDIETIDGDILTKELEGKVVLASGPYKVYEDVDKVKIVHTTDVRTGETKSITVNGIPHQADVKFSRTNPEVKFSFTKQLTELQRNNKTLPAILRAQTEIEGRIENDNILEEDLIALTTLQELERLTAMGNDALSTFDILTSKLPIGLDGVNIQFKTVDEFVQYIKDTTLPRIRQEGFTAAKVYLENKLKGKTLKEQKKIIDSFLKNIGRSTRTGAIEGITTNRQLKENVIDKLLNGKFKNIYKLRKVESGEAFEGVELYENIENIKNNVRANEDLRNKVNRQALEAEEFVFEILDSNLPLSQKLAMIDLMALDQRGPVRKLYKMGATVVNNMSSKKLTLEHEITASDMVNYLKKYARKELDKETLKEVISKARVHVLPKKIDDILKKQGLKSKGGIQRYKNPKVKTYLQNLKNKGVIDFIPADISLSEDANVIANAILFSRTTNKTKGITVLDFDDTLATSKSLIRFTRPNGTKGTLTPEQYAATYEDLLDLGYEFDFSEFSKVVDGKPAPLLNKAKKLAGKFGTKDMFVLTARPADSAPAIKEFLKQNGLNIPLENITGLGNSTAEAKALWVADKAANGYNDFYFADDALKNVQAVQNMLDQFDVKSKVQQAKVKFSRALSPEFNKMLQRTKGVGVEKTFSRVAAQKRGKNVGKFRFFVPPSADDFAGLLRYFVGKGEQGNKDLKFFNEALIKPFARADEGMKKMRQRITDDYKTLRKTFPDVTKKLGNMIDDTGFTFDNAVRVYLWDKAGFEIPGLSKEDIKLLTNRVKTDQDLKNYADVVASIANQPEGYLEPGQQWEVENVASDLQNVVNKVGRKKFLGEWIENKNEIFSEANLNKIEATYGSNFREALENILWRMENGTNRAAGMGRIESAWNNWINGSVGAIMFFNARSAVLQTLSTVNFINFEDNNIFAAAKAFANQKQYWKDFTFLFNSSFLKQRRAGLQTNINEAELASAVAGATNKAKAAIRYILKIGFTPTQVADSFAIASGGATYYRNRIKKYVKEGMDQKAAEKQAMLDFQEIAEETQQSARPDRISQQQASSLGRIILAFANTPMQYNRLIKKAAGDLVNKRGDWRSNVSRIIYYGALQNIIFSSLQSAIFALAFDDEEPDKDEIDQKTQRIINGTMDTLLRGSGIAGAVVATIKNSILEFIEQKEKKGRADYAYVLVEALNVSPPIGSKARRIYVGALKSYEYNADVIPEMDAFDLENPIYNIVGNITSATLNLPLDRVFRKIDNMKEVFNQDNQTWQRIALALGWDQWSLGIDPYKDVKEAEKKLREEKSKNKKKKSSLKGLKGLK